MRFVRLLEIPWVLHGINFFDKNSEKRPLDVKEAILTKGAIILTVLEVQTISLALAFDMSEIKFVEVVEYLGQYAYVAEKYLLPLVEKNLVPDWVIRFGVRQELEGELAKVQKLTCEEVIKKKQEFVGNIDSFSILKPNQT